MKECGSTLFRWDWRWTLALRPARLQVSRRRNKAMSGGWLVEIVVLAMIAGFVALRLVSVLGRRTGHEQPLPQTLDRSDRKSVVQGKRVSVRVDLVGRRMIK